METMAFFQVRLFTVQCVCWCWWLPSGPRLEGPPRGVVVRPYYWYDSNTITVRSCVAHLDGSLHKWCARCFHNWLLSSRGKDWGWFLCLAIYLNSLVRSVTLFTTPLGLHSTSCQCWKWENTSTCLLPVIHENGLAAAAPGGARHKQSLLRPQIELDSRLLSNGDCSMTVRDPKRCWAAAPRASFYKGKNDACLFSRNWSTGTNVTALTCMLQFSTINWSPSRENYCMYVCIYLLILCIPFFLLPTTF